MSATSNRLRLMSEAYVCIMNLKYTLVKVFIGVNTKSFGMCTVDAGKSSPTHLYFPFVKNTVNVKVAKTNNPTIPICLISSFASLIVLRLRFLLQYVSS